MKGKCYSLFLNTASVKALTSFLVLILRTISADPVSNRIRISGRPVIAKSMLGFFAPAVSNIFKKRNTYHLQRDLYKTRSHFFFHEGEVPAACFLSIASTETKPSLFASGEGCNRCEFISPGKRTRSFYFIPALDA